MVSVVLVAVASLAIHQVYQANSWPSLDEEPPLAVPQVAAPTDSWFALKAVMAAVPMEHRDRIQAALKGKGMSVDRGVWALAADQVEALSSVMESSSIVSPTRTFANKDSQPSLIPLMLLAEAQILRGWDRYDGGDNIEAVKGMLRADRLGQQLANGSQSLLMSVVGYSIQEKALKALQDLLFVAHEPSVHALVAERLPLQAPQADRFRASLLRECANSEALLLDPLKTEAAVPEARGSKRLPGILFDRDATVAQHRKWCRAADAWLALLPAQRGRPPAYLPEGLSKVLTYNAIGLEYLKVLSLEGYLNMAESVRERQLHREVLRLLTAARRYAFAHSGQLPARADLLVPKYLPSVPLDPFTQAALKIASEQIKGSRGEPVWITLPTAPDEP